jgi:hypothetical protein
MQNSILIKNTASGAVSEVSDKVWNLMILDGRSRKYSVIPAGTKLYIEPEPEIEKIEIRPVFSKKKKKDEPELDELNLNINQEQSNEGTD